jgi:hypothetical protein
MQSPRFFAIFTGVLLWATQSANKVAARAFEADARPLLVIKVEPLEEDWLDNQADVTFRIVNVGRGAGIVTRLCRSWQITDRTDEVEPVVPSKKPRLSSVKESQFAIGPGQDSGPIRMRMDILAEGSHPNKRFVFFLGYVRYYALNGKCFTSGFCQVFDKKYSRLGFHQSWPNRHADRFNYHEETHVRSG